MDFLTENFIEFKRVDPSRSTAHISEWKYTARFLYRIIPRDNSLGDESVEFCDIVIAGLITGLGSVLELSGVKFRQSLVRVLKLKKKKMPVFIGSI